MRIHAVSIAVALAFACINSACVAQTEGTKFDGGVRSGTKAGSNSYPQAASPRDSSRPTPIGATGGLPCQAFTHPPDKAHDPAELVFAFDQLEHWYRVPGEFTHRLDGDRYGFETMSFIVSETYPGGGPGLHVHDTEEAHILLHGTAQYQIGDKTFTVRAPYVAKVPAGVAHTFINAGTEPFNLIAVFATPHPSTTRIGPNPLVSAWQDRNGPPPCSTLP